MDCLQLLLLLSWNEAVSVYRRLSLSIFCVCSWSMIPLPISNSYTFNYLLMPDMPLNSPCFFFLFRFDVA